MKTSEPYLNIKRAPTKEEIRLVKRNGKNYKAAVLPADIERGPLGMCFDWSMIQCMKLGEKYRYCEGLARGPYDDNWVLHAWLTDGIHAFDATWLAYKNGTNEEIVPPVRYIGIEMPLMAIVLFVRRTKYQGIIPNRDKDPGTLKRILERLN